MGGWSAVTTYASGMVFILKVTKKKICHQGKSLPQVILSIVGTVIVRRIGFCMYYYDRLSCVVRYEKSSQKPRHLV